MFRKAGIGFAALAMLAPSIASALGVGDYDLSSYLNQPLKMTVELSDTGDLEPEEILISLASQKDFDAVGVERLFFLSSLEFDVELRGDGTGQLTITSSQSVREPYLDFLVEVLWPQGRILRNYTVLLDPPTYADDLQTVAPVAPSAPVQPIAPVQQPAQPVAAPVESSVAAAPASSPAYTGARDEYVVQAQDTMWSIGLNNRPSKSVSVQQMMLAIQELNPDAFIDGNVNLVREGMVLRMPTEDEVRSISARQALGEMADQNRQWREKLERKGITIPSSDKSSQIGSRAGSTSAEATAIAETGEVSLVTTDTGSGAAGDVSGAGSDPAALQNELAIRSENLDKLNRENQELDSRLSDLESQLKTSDELLTLRNNQIAQLQEQLRQLQEAQGITPTDPLVSDADLAQIAGSDASAAGATAGSSTNAGTAVASPEGAAAGAAVAVDGSTAGAAAGAGQSTSATGVAGQPSGADANTNVGGATAPTSSTDVAAAGVDAAAAQAGAGNQASTAQMMQDENINLDQTFETLDQLTKGGQPALTGNADIDAVMQTSGTSTMGAMRDQMLAGADPEQIGAGQAGAPGADGATAGAPGAGGVPGAGGPQAGGAQVGQPGALGQAVGPDGMPIVPEQDAGIMGTLKDNIVLIGAGLAALLLIGVLLVVRNRQESQGAEGAAAGASSSGSNAESDDDFFVDDIGDEEVEGTFEGDDVQAEDDAGPKQDVLEQVDVYVAYGKHAEALDLMRSEISSDPGRSDVKIRLLEVLADMNDRDALKAEADNFADDAQASAKAQELLSGLDGGVEELDSLDSSLDELEMDLSGDVADIDGDDFSMDLDLNAGADADADDAEMDMDATLVLDSTEEMGAVDESSDDLDFSLDDAPADAADDAGDSLDMDLDLDLGGDEPAAASDDLSLDMDTDSDSGDMGDLDLSLDDASDDLSLDMDDASDDLSLDMDDSADDLSLELDSADEELSLDGPSDEFEQATEASVSEDLDLSLDDIDLGEGAAVEDDATEVGISALDLEDQPEESGGADELSLELDAADDMASDDLSLDGDSDDLSLELDGADDLDLALDAEEPVEDATEQRGAVDLDGGDAATDMRSAIDLDAGADDDDFDFLGDTDENATKLDLAKAYIDMGDSEGARDILNEVIAEGSDTQQKEAKDLLAQV